MLFEIEDGGGQCRWVDAKLPRQQLSEVVRILEGRLKSHSQQL